MVKLLCNDSKLIISVTNENKFIIPACATIINKDQNKKEGIEISRVSSSDEPNTMDYHMRTLLSYNEGRGIASNTDLTKDIRFVNPEKIRFVTPEDQPLVSQADQPL